MAEVSTGMGPMDGRPLPEVVRVAYSLGNAFADVLDTSTQSGI